MVNKKGQTLGITILGAIFILIIGMACINLLLPEITDFRTNMNCASAETISDANKLICLVVDLSIPLYIWGILTIVIGGILVYFYIR